MARPRLLLATGAVLVLAFTAVATVPANDGTFYACITSQGPTRTLQLVDPSNRLYHGCPRGQVLVSWNAAGVPGPPGSPGAPGEPGAGLSSIDDLGGVACQLAGQNGTVLVVTGWTSALQLFCVVPGVDDPVAWYADRDTDLHGDPNGTVLAPVAPAGYVAAGDDCDDADATKFPGYAEDPDGKDNDCDGLVDEGIQSWSFDTDGDSYGLDSTAQLSNFPPGLGWVPLGGDCDDSDPTVYPGAVELPDGKDNDCNGVVEA